MWSYLLTAYVSYAVGISVGAAVTALGALVWRRYGKVVAK
jgi:hypothetical protein